MVTRLSWLYIDGIETKSLGYKVNDFYGSVTLLGERSGEPIRLTLAALNISFTDHRYSTSSPLWRRKLEKHLPFGQLPALGVDGIFIVQADSCARLAAKLAELFPDDPVKAAESDMVVVHQAEIQKAIARLSFDGVPGRKGLKSFPKKKEQY